METNNQTGGSLNLIFYIILGILIVVGLSGLADSFDGRPFASSFIDNLKHPSLWQILLSGAGIVVAVLAIIRTIRSKR